MYHHPLSTPAHLGYSPPGSTEVNLGLLHGAILNGTQRKRFSHPGDLRTLLNKLLSTLFTTLVFKCQTLCTSEKRRLQTKIGKCLPGSVPLGKTMPSLGQRCRESHQASGSLGGRSGAPRAEHTQQLPQAQTFRNAPSLPQQHLQCTNTSHCSVGLAHYGHRALCTHPA